MIAIGIVALVSACEGGAVPPADAALSDVALSDVGPPDAPILDAASPRDAHRVTDAFVDSDAYMSPLDGGIDAFAVPVDAGTDARFDCSACRPAEACEVLSCVDGCVYAPLADGEACGDDVCLAGACVARGCGDGWRERGDGSWAAEECDDGNTTPGDGCSEVCLAEVVSIPSVGIGVPRLATGRPAAALDDAGNLLVTWMATGATPDNRYVYAQRFDRHGSPIDATPLELDVGHSLVDFLPTVVGLPDGWVVAWQGQVALRQVRFAVVPSTGAPGPTRIPDTTTAYNLERPVLTRLASRFFLTWSVRDAMQDRLRARAYDFGGTPLGAMFDVRPTAMPAESDPLTAWLGGDRWLMVYRQGFSDTTLQLMTLTGSVADAPGTLVHGTTGQFVISSDGLGVVVGNNLSGIRGQVTVGQGDIAALPADDSGHTVWMNTRPYGSVVVGALPRATGAPATWFAFWRTPPLVSAPVELVTSPGAAAPAALVRLAASLTDSATRIDQLSLAPVSADARDGWLLTYVSYGSQVHVLRVTP